MFSRHIGTYLNFVCCRMAYTHLIGVASVQTWSKSVAQPPRNVLCVRRRRRPHPKNTACWQSVMKANTNLFYDASLVLVINVSACSEVRYLTLGSQRERVSFSFLSLTPSRSLGSHFTLHVGISGCARCGDGGF